MKKKANRIKTNPNYEKPLPPHILSLNQHSNKNISINISYNLDPNALISPHRLNTENYNPNNSLEDSSSCQPQKHFNSLHRKGSKKQNKEMDCTFQQDDRHQPLYTQQDKYSCSPQSILEPCQISIKLMGKNHPKNIEKQEYLFQNIAKPAKRRLHTEEATSGVQTCTNKRSSGKRNFFSTHQDIPNNLNEYSSNHNPDFERLTAMYKKHKKKEQQPKSRSQSKSKITGNNNSNTSAQKRKSNVNTEYIKNELKKMMATSNNPSKQLPSHSVSNNNLKSTATSKQLKHKYSESQFNRKTGIKKNPSGLPKSKSIEKVSKKDMSTIPQNSTMFSISNNNDNSKKQLIRKQTTKKSLLKKKALEQNTNGVDSFGNLIQMKSTDKNNNLFNLSKDLMRLLKDKSSSLLSQQIQSSIREKSKDPSNQCTTRELEQLCDTYTLVNKYSLQVTSGIREMRDFQKKNTKSNTYKAQSQDKNSGSSDRNVSRQKMAEAADTIKNAWRYYKQMQVMNLYAGLFTEKNIQHTLYQQQGDGEEDEIFEVDDEEEWAHQAEHPFHQQNGTQQMMTSDFRFDQQQIQQYPEDCQGEEKSQKSDQEGYWDDQDQQQHQHYTSTNQRLITHTDMGSEEFQFDQNKYKFMVEECIKVEESRPISRQEEQEGSQELQRPSWNRISQLLHEQILHNKLDPKSLLPEMIKQSQLNKRWIEDADVEGVNNNLHSHRTEYYYANLIEQKGIVDKIKSQTPRLPLSSNTYDLKHSSSRRVSLSSSTSSLHGTRKLYQSHSSKSLNNLSDGSSSNRLKRLMMIGRSSNNSSASKKNGNNTSKIQELINNEIIRDDDDDEQINSPPINPKAIENDDLLEPHNTAFQSQEEQIDNMIIQFKKKSIDSFLDVGLHECGVQQNPQKSIPAQQQQASTSDQQLEYNQQIKIRSGGVQLLQTPHKLPQLPIVSWYPLSLDSMEEEGLLDCGDEPMLDTYNAGDNQPVSLYFKSASSPLSGANSARTEIYQGIFEHLVEEFVRELSKKSRFIRNLVDSTSSLKQMPEPPIHSNKIPKASCNAAQLSISTNPSDIRSYLSKLMQFVLRNPSEKQTALKHINTHMGISSDKMLYYLRQDYCQGDGNEFDDSEFGPDGCPYDESVMVITLNCFQNFETGLQQQTAINPYLECWHRALFESFNECLDEFRPYGLNGKPYDWQVSTHVNSTPILETTIENTFESAVKRVVQYSTYLSGTIFDKPENIALYFNKDVTEDHREQIQEDRMSRMLADELLDEEPTWVDYEDEKLELAIELSQAIYQRVLFEMTTELKKLARRRALLT